MSIAVSAARMILPMLDEAVDLVGEVQRGHAHALALQPAGVGDALVAQRIVAAAVSTSADAVPATRRRAAGRRASRHGRCGPGR